jgi:hypothetical protein
MAGTPPVGIAIETTVGQEQSAVSWGAILAGALAAIATTLIMMVVGSGLGFSLISPWASENPEVSTLAASTLVWFGVTQWISSGFGGYLAGRLRTRWADVPRDEVYFRDTAHGFLAWALATAIVASVLTTAISVLVGGTVAVTSNVASAAAQGAGQAAVQSGATVADPTGYYTDMLFRSGPSTAAGAQAGPTPATPATPGLAPPAPAATGPSTSTTVATEDTDRRGEATRILINGAAAGEIPASDREYLAELVASETGLSGEEASARVDEVLARAEQAKAELQQTAEQAREGAVFLSISMAVALLLGAFIASAAAVIGGRERDDFKPSAIAS